MEVKRFHYTMKHVVFVYELNVMTLSFTSNQLHTDKQILVIVSLQTKV